MNASTSTIRHWLLTIVVTAIMATVATTTVLNWSADNVASPSMQYAGYSNEGGNGGG